MRICDNCSLEFDYNVKFCAQCGAKTKDFFTSLACQDCNTLVGTGVKFCPECGGKVMPLLKGVSTPPPPIFSPNETQDECESFFTGSKTITDEEGNVYIGNFLNGKYHGQGKMIYLNGVVYEGSWLNSERNGRGVLISRNGARTESTFVGGGIAIEAGPTIRLEPDGTRVELEGYWFGTGQGKTTFSDGSGYQGAYLDGEESGFGKYIYSNGDVYEGNWLNGEINGLGRMTYADGAVYDGNWLNDKRHGQGKMVYSDGGIYAMSICCLVTGCWVFLKVHPMPESLPQQAARQFLRRGLSNWLWGGDWSPL